MSYEGYTEYICPKGHIWECDVYLEDSNAHVCKMCGNRAEWIHDVDQTNGINHEDPGTFSAGVIVRGYEDYWHVDHYGNRYAQKIPLRKPAPGSAWRKMVY